MDGDDAPSCTEIKWKDYAKKRYGENTSYNVSNEIDDTTDKEWWNGYDNEIPKIFPMNSPIRHESLSKSLLNIKCRNIHSIDPVNEEPTKDTDSYFSGSANKSCYLTNSTLEGMKFGTAPRHPSMKQCLLKEKSTKQFTFGDSYPYSVPCCCKKCDKPKNEKSHYETNIYENKSITTNDFNIYTYASSSVSDDTDTTLTCSCTSTVTNMVKSNKNVSLNSCCCGASTPAIADKDIQSKIENYDVSCGCAVKVHSTGTKMYPISEQLDNIPEKLFKKTRFK